MDIADDSATGESSRPPLDPKEARVLASLMEKQLTTPNNYPLTPNGLKVACNQKSSREPVMSMTEGEVRHLLNLLENRGLVKVDSGERTYRVSHRMKQAYKLERGEMAILTVLMLRFPQTLNDIFRRTARMYEFSDVDEVQLVVEEMMERATPLAVLLPHSAGRREDRYFHTLCGEMEFEEPAPPPPLPVEATPGQTERIELLEQRLDTLEARLDEVLQQMLPDSPDN